MNKPAHQSLYISALASMIALILLCIAWETVVAPLRPGGSWLVIKVIPLLIPLRGIWKRDVYTLQWSSMLILLFLAEGAVRATTETGWSQAMAIGEVILVVVFFVSTLLYLRPYKQTAKRLAKEAIRKASESVNE
ncbi:DUF2069 domain-containing protein [Lacisediminimonas profundi]|uniref:DUF2069 domain-containing protein n=1 Tax=Lacisediminimonas profundi TaxID=2603856 RepID=UPI00124B9EBD|nr:DUF2069 domain-containing protein [Lacisediminimonas profundi]